jgi:hypothetical protein
VGKLSLMRDCSTSWITPLLILLWRLYDTDKRLMRSSIKRRHTTRSLVNDRLAGRRSSVNIAHLCNLA